MSEIDTDGLPTVVALDPEHRQSRYRCLTTVNIKALKVGDVVIVQNCIDLPKQEAVVLSILRREIVEPSLLAKIPHESSSISLNDIVNETEKTQTSQSPNSAAVSPSDIDKASDSASEKHFFGASEIITPFAANFGQLCGYESQEYACVTVGVSLVHGDSEWHLADEQLEPPHYDRYQFDDPALPLLLSSQLAFAKAHTDFIFEAYATSPSGSVIELPIHVTISADGRSQSIEMEVVGDQHLDCEGVSSRQPFSTMPLGFERAYGGGYTIDDKQSWYDLHPGGRGHLPETSLLNKLDQGVWLPNCFAKGESSLHPSVRKTTVALGPMPASHNSRRQYSGTYGDNWQLERAPYLPDDFHPLFFQSAHEALRW